MKYFDKHLFQCVGCGHIWILGSNIFITDKQYNEWVEEVLFQHAKIAYERRKKDDK